MTTVNTCFDALDRHVIAGHAEDVALAAGDRRYTYAELLGEVAAFAGVLRALGVTLGAPVAVDLPPGPEAVISLLGCARLGAVPSVDGSVSVRVEDGEVMVADLTWEQAMRAGRTDPAPVVLCDVDYLTDPSYAVLAPLIAGETLTL